PETDMPPPGPPEDPLEFRPPPPAEDPIGFRLPPPPEDPLKFQPPPPVPKELLERQNLIRAKQNFRRGMLRGAEIASEIATKEVRSKLPRFDIGDTDNALKQAITSLPESFVAQIDMTTKILTTYREALADQFDKPDVSDPNKPVELFNRKAKEIIVD